MGLLVVWGPKELAYRESVGVIYRVHGGYIGVLLGLYWIMEKKMETTACSAYGLRFRGLAVVFV